MWKAAYGCKVKSCVPTRDRNRITKLMAKAKAKAFEVTHVGFATKLKTPTKGGYKYSATVKVGNKEIVVLLQKHTSAAGNRCYKVCAFKPA